MREDFVPFIAKLVESQNMKNPSLGELRSLCQFNQVSKEENQRRNLTFISFTSYLSTCKIFASSFFNLRNWWGVCIAGQRAKKLKEFCKFLFNLRNFWKSLLELANDLWKTCEWIAKDLRNHNWRKAISQVPVLTWEIFSSPF